MTDKQKRFCDEYLVDFNATQAAIRAGYSKKNSCGERTVNMTTCKNTREACLYSQLKQGDCLELMKEIPDGSIDMILCDLPYGITECKWDSVIPLDLLWKQYKRIIKPKGNIALFSNQPFTTELISSNLSQYRYTWYWKKNNVTGSIFAKVQPMRCIEEINIFSKGARQDNTGEFPKTRSYLQEERRKTGLSLVQLKELLNSHMTSHYFTNGSQFLLPTESAYKKLQTTGFFKMPYNEIQELYKCEKSEKSEKSEPYTYNPQGLISLKKPIINRAESRRTTQIYHLSKNKNDSIQGFTNYPKNLIEFDNEAMDSRKRFHPTQKPVALLEYLIKTYSNEGETVLDNCMGSGSTGVAAVNTGRNFIGFELDEKYFEIAKQRIDDAVFSLQKND